MIYAPPHLRRGFLQSEVNAVKRLLICLMLLLCAALPALAEETPYRQKVSRPDEMIFSGPGYDEFCVGTVRKAGVYTIVEEADDGEGHLWGRLKSGAGWIDLTHVRDVEIAAWPVSAAFAADCPPVSACQAFWMEEGEWTSWIVFRAWEPLTDVRLVEYDMAEADYADPQTLHTLPQLDPDVPFLAGVVFAGDMTTYGLVFTDAAGQQQQFAVSISGRNGMLVLERLSLTDP